tara:strand:+ start:4363 stop:5424 length:1062 start_codon:yes stop_codon:yes gene_type:complete
MQKYHKIIVTGGAGFIGGTIIRKLLKEFNSTIYNIDKISYSSDLSSILSIPSSQKRHHHLKIDLKESSLLDTSIEEIKPDIIIHCAAESHVDRSIQNPFQFIESNIIGTFNLLESARKYWNKIDSKKRNIFRFHHISTDEVFGSLEDNKFFDEFSNYSPRSPYSASKASSDHLVSSWNNTFGLPTLITNCSNNFGPYQFPEKLIPITILKAINREEIPIYGDGSNIRDWIFVDDHVNAIFKVISSSDVGERYCIGGNCQITNLDLVNNICSIIDKYNPKPYMHKELITFVSDRAGHDKRYAIDNKYIKKKINWEPKHNFKQALENTVKWYLENLDWCKSVMKKSGYNGERLGL